jgi:hypothetical protein
MDRLSVFSQFISSAIRGKTGTRVCRATCAPKLRAAGAGIWTGLSRLCLKKEMEYA